MSAKDEVFNISKPSWLGKVTRGETTKEEIDDAEQHIKDEPSYAENGWTPETLAIYFKERKEAQSNNILSRRPTRPMRTNGRHNPHRWRR